MLQPLTLDLRFPFAEDLVKSYGPYLEQLTKDDKYCLIVALAGWLYEEAALEYTLGTRYITADRVDDLVGDERVSPAARTILTKHMSQWNEPIMQSLMTALIQQLREGYFRGREIDELEDIGMEQYCDLPGYSSLGEKYMDASDADGN
jgi:hypothetical protein